MPQHTIEFYIERDDEELELEVTADVEPFVPGKLTGPPEDCYPDEGGTADITDIKLDGKPFDGLTDYEYGMAVEAVEISYGELGEGGYENCWADDDYHRYGEGR